MGEYGAVNGHYEKSRVSFKEVAIFKSSAVFLRKSIWPKTTKKMACFVHNIIQRPVTPKTCTAH